MGAAGARTAANLIVANVSTDTRAVQKLVLFWMLVRSTCSTKLCKRSSFLMSYKQGFRHRPLQFAPLLILSEAAIAVHQGVWRRRLLWE